MESEGRGSQEERRRQKDFLYTVLNLPVYASEADIKERHRALSLVFHPDKQRDETLREATTEKFLEIQAAYEILSDPFLREVYDTLGYEGLKINFPNHIRSLPSDELRPELRKFFYESHSAQLQTQVNSCATLKCSLDARELIYDDWLARDWYTDLSERLAATKLSIISLRHSFSKRLGQQTKLQVISKVGYADLEDEDMPVSGSPGRYAMLRGNVMGVFSHQYSPTKQLQVKASLTNFRGVRLSWMHENKLNFVRVSVPFRPILAPPPVAIAYRRRLFRDSLTLGTIDCVLNRRAPEVNIGLTGPAIARKETMLTTGWAAGLSLRATMPGPGAYIQLHAVWPALSTVLMIGFEYNFLTGLANTVEGAWSSENNETDLAAAVVWDMGGVVLRLTCSYLGQTLVLPITLTNDYAPRLALMSALIPASAFALADYFYLRRLRASRRAKRREEHEHAQHDQISERRAEAEAVMTMLKDAARRTIQAEKQNDGLVILEARYFPLEDNGAPMLDLGIDVTAAIQVLIIDGQLFIPGGRSKSVLRGFYDPLPECAKRLSIRYEFRGRMHYAEVGELAPLILPLEGHLVERTGTDDKWPSLIHTQTSN